MTKLSVADVPHMLKMWNQELNTETPGDVSANCSAPKYWKCPDCGYAWSASPKARYNSSGKCPCHESNKVIRKGVNDVLTLVKGLDAFLDEDNDFEEIYKQGLDSKLIVNFECKECGRKWTASLKSQIKKDDNGEYFATGCPHYNTVKRKKDEIPFCSEVESIIRFWDDENSMEPTTTKSNSNEPAHFICKNCGHNWTTEIRSQARGTGKCMCCELQRVTRKGFTDVFTLVPESKRFYNFDKNSDIDIYSIPLRNTQIQIDWKCPDCGREWKSPLAFRIRGKKGEYSFIGCQACYLHDKKRITPVASVPMLLKHWDFDKNKKRDLDPKLTSAYADELADWRCKECGYEWKTNIRSRMNSDSSCPFCERTYKAIMTGVNDVLSLCPEFSTIYDFDYNAKKGIDIYKEGASSKKTVHFKCQNCGHEWDSPIYKRVKKNDDGTYKLVGCSVCSHGLFRKVPYSVEFPLLAKMYREDLNNISLDSIRGAKAISQTYYYWECPHCGETFESTLNAMKESHQKPTHGCPYCSSTKLRKGESFAELHPELMDEYDSVNIIDPYKVFANCKDSVEWICKDCGHHWNATFALRHAGGGKCPVCNRSVLIPDKNSFAAVYPEFVKYWADSNERKADEVFYNSSEWFRVICPVCGNEHGAYLDDFVNGDSCPYCKSIRLSPETNSLRVLYPDIAKRWSPNNSFGPEMVLPTSCERVKWICDTCNGEYGALIKDIIEGIDECPYCKGTRVLPGFNSVKALYPNIAKRWSPNNDYDSDMMLPTSCERVKWICDTCTGEYSARVKDVVNGEDECPYCSGKKVLPGFNSFADKHPDLVAEMDEVANYLLSKSPYEVLDTSDYKFWFICKNDPKHKYSMSPRTRLMFQKRGREPCLYCRGHRRKLHHFVSHNKKP